MSFVSRGFVSIQSYPLISANFIKNAGITNSTQVRALGYLGEAIYDLALSTKLTSVYPFIGGSAVTHQYNFLNTAQFPLTFVGSPTQSSDGTTFNGTTQYATAFQLGTAAGLNMANLSGGFRTKNMGGTGDYIPWGFFMPSGAQTVTYSTPGSFTFNPLTEGGGATGFTVSVWGGGGAGGGANSAASAFSAGGGAGGNFATRAVTVTSTSTSMTITVGNGGTAATAVAGGSGGTSTVSHPDFTTTFASGGGGGGANTAAAGAAGAVNTGRAGTTTFTGGTGSVAGNTATRGGGGGGSSAGTAANGVTPNTPGGGGAGGAGGAAVAGGGTGGAGGANPNGVGVTGPFFGGGGGGAGGRTTGFSPGGGGAAGRVTIAWTVPLFKRFTLSVFNTTSQQLFDGSVTTDVTSRWSALVGTPGVATNGNRIFTRRANTGVAATDGAFYLNGSPIANQAIAVLANTNLVGTPLLYLGAANTWNNRAGNATANLYSGTLNFAFVGSGLTDADIGNMDTIMTTYTNILGR